MTAAPLPPLTTVRLWLTPMAPAHADDLHVARGDDVGMRHWHSGVSPSAAATRAEVVEMTASGSYWVFGRHGETTALGYVGFIGDLRRDANVGFGYCLRRDAWGAGLTVEAARAALTFGFDDIGIACAELWIAPGNTQSVRVAEKLGCAQRAWAPLGRRGGTELSLVHGVTAAEWRHVLEPPATLNVVPVVQVSDVAAAMARWVDGLGFRVAWTVGDPPARGQVVARWTGGAGVRLVPGRARSVVSVQVGCDLDALVARAVEAGWILTSPAAAQPWGTRDATIADPDGNVVALAAAIPA